MELLFEDDRESNVPAGRGDWLLAGLDIERSQYVSQPCA